MAFYENDVLSSLRRENYSVPVLSSALQFTGRVQEELFLLARESRRRYFCDNNVQVRSVIEISNICRQGCRYCAIGNKTQEKDFALNAEQILNLAEYLYNKGRKNILLQSGENVNETFICEVERAIWEIKDRYPDIRIILCLGNLSYIQYKRLYDAGANDYILKFETSNETLFSYCKPNDSLNNRLECIYSLNDIGYRVGSGNIVGLPGQSIDDLVADLILAHKLPLAMNSTTIFIPAENTAFANESMGNLETTLNMMALLRIMNPGRLMPTTSSLEKASHGGQFLGLMAGANTVTIHDGTPEELQQYFPIYSSKRVRPQVEHLRDIVAQAGLCTENI